MADQPSLKKDALALLPCRHKVGFVVFWREKNIYVDIRSYNSVLMPSTVGTISHILLHPKNWICNPEPKKSVLEVAVSNPIFWIFKHKSLIIFPCVYLGAWAIIHTDYWSLMLGSPPTSSSSKNPLIIFASALMPVLLLLLLILLFCHLLSLLPAVGSEIPEKILQVLRLELWTRMKINPDLLGDSSKLWLYW